MEKQKDFSEETADILMEKPRVFSVGRKRFYLYPVTLGKSYLLARLSRSLGLEADGRLLNGYAEALRLCVERTATVCRLVTLHTIRKRENLFDNAFVLRRAAYLRKNLSAEDLAKLFLLTLQRPDWDGVLSFLGLDAERKRLDKIMAVKKRDGHTQTFFGKSVAGSFIIPACQKLGLKPQEAIWGVSYDLLRLLLSDVPVDIYLTDEDMRKGHVPMDGLKINGDNKERMAEFLRSQRWD